MDKNKNYINEEEICEVLNNNFQLVFTQEQPFDIDENTQVTSHKLGNIILSKREIKEEMKNFHGKLKDQMKFQTGC